MKRDYFTKEQIEDIRRKLLAYSKKDIEIDMADTEQVNPKNDTVVIVKEDGTNERLSLYDLRPVWESI